MGTTVGASNKITAGYAVLGGGDCQNGGGFTSPDLIFAVTPSSGGMLSVTLDTGYPNPLVQIRTKACNADSSDELYCNGLGQAGSQTSTLNVSGNTTYFIIVGSWQNNASNQGTFTLTLSLT